MTTPAQLVESGRLRRVDAALGAWLARAYPDASVETVLAVALAARAIADGHSALQLDRAQAWLDGLGDGKAPTLPTPAVWAERLRASSAVHAHADDNAPTDLRPLVLDAQGRVYLRRYFEYERHLAAALVERVGTAPAPLVVADGDSEQQRAIEAALTHRFTLITGGPGTGKTHGVVRMLAALAAQAHTQGTPLRIALAASTGKAAARLKESVRAQRMTLDLPADVAAQIPDDARTLHRLLGLSPWSAKPRHDHTTPLPFDIVVVDEVSMVDLPLMAKLADAVAPAARLILLGDPDQLSAVEAGNVLGALTDAARHAPFADCHVALTRSHRFGADSVLGELARAIAAQRADEAIAICARGGNVTLADAVQSRRWPEDAAQAYRPVLDAATPDEALAAARGFRVLTALRHGPTGCIALDRAIAARLQRQCGARADTRWWRGRLVLVTANRPELGLFNGDTGVIWPDAEGAMQAWFEGDAGAPRGLPVAALPPHEGAFALTVHKAQGSEFERVALVTGPDSAALTRELLYTGVTRARSGLEIFSTPEVLRTGIERRTLRMTGLADRLREAAHSVA